MQDLQDHCGFEGKEDDESDDGWVVKHIWHMDFWEGGLRKVHAEQVQEGEEDEDDIWRSLRVKEGERKGVLGVWILCRRRGIRRC